MVARLAASSGAPIPVSMSACTSGRSTSCAAATRIGKRVTRIAQRAGASTIE